MAQPQRENGHTGIANEIMDALGRTPLGNANAQILWVILRKTYGWNKKADSISITQFMNITGLSRRTVVYALQNLEAKNMITVQRNKTEQSYNDVNLIGFQKDYDKWVVQGIAQNYKKTLQKQRDNYKTGVVQGKVGSARIGKEVVQGLVNDEPFLAPTIDTITKESITKEREIEKVAPPSPQDFFNSWNEKTKNTPIAQARELSKGRIAKIKTRLSERSFSEWQTVFEIMAQSKFCCGDNDRGWKVSLDWIIDNDTNAVKVLENKYTNKPKNDWRNNPKGTPLPDRTRHNLAVMDALAREREEKTAEQKRLQEGEKENERLGQS